HVPQLLRALRAGDEFGGVAADLLGADQEVVEATDRGEVTGDRGRGLAVRGERGGVATYLSMAEVAGLEALGLRPAGERGEVDRVGASRPLGGAAGPQVPVVTRQCRIPVHGSLILRRTPVPFTPCRRLAAEPRNPPRLSALTNEDRGAYFDLLVELFDVGDRHPHTAVGRGAAERGGLFGAVDPGAFVDPHPARLDRVRGARRDGLPGEIPRPVGFRHVPDRVFFLRLDFVEPFGGFEAFLADRDGVGLGQLQVPPEAQGEGAAVEGQVGRVALGDLGG